MKQLEVEKKHFILLIIVLLLVCMVYPANLAKADSATLSVTTGSTAEELANKLIGDGIVMTNPQLHAGIPEAVGLFSGGSDVVGFAEGIILSTGNAGQVVGTYDVQPDNTTGGGNDSDLDGLGMGTSNDACYLTFDIVPSGDAISFQYVLASDEYEEYIDFADLFGLFYAEVDGAGDIIGSYQNMAWIPGTDPAQPVSVGTINRYSNPDLFRSNTWYEVDEVTIHDDEGTIASAMDGFTRVLSVSQPLTSGTKYRIKLAIGDISDTSIDSNVFIKANSVTGQGAKYGEIEPQSKSENSGMIDVVIYRSDGSDGSATAEWQALDGSGSVVDSGTVVFGDGEVNKVISVPSTTVTVKLLNPSGGITIKTEETPLEDLPETVDEADASLTNLAVSVGTLTPAFDKAVTGYTVEVENGTTSIKVTPTATNPLSTIKVNGESVDSGTESSAIDLSIGENVINVIVTSEDTLESETYSITVTRLAAPEPTPSATPEPTQPGDVQRGIISGYALDPDGNPMAGYEITIHSDPVTVVTDGDGRFVFTDVELTNHTLIIKKPDGTELGQFSLNFTKEGEEVYSIDETDINISYSYVTVAIEIELVVRDAGVEVVDVDFVSNPDTGDDSKGMMFIYALIILVSIISVTGIKTLRKRIPN